MDAGWAAVIAGASGAGGAALAAWATGRAMIRQARLQAKSGFDQWLRERQQEACAMLLSAGDAVNDALDTVIGHTVHPPGPEERQAAWRAVNEALNGFHRACRAAEIVCRRDVGAQALAMRVALHNVVDVWRGPTNSPADQRAIAFADARRTWVEHAARYIAMVEELVQTFDGD
ncbi:hypothetical protein J7F01_41190 [Streptomyces sp. ISL-22]|uniref:hypothetical protein n=1 Tax=unclassified Streptomyces TaxID=2593676 RepID=UPI001BECD24D|nr:MULTISPECIES: hypothetical protein [unclassified Streptomyces]MBT2423451.1 hypothetical protein [Streptomyces sp. ISL-24]MBT2438406.1 hypothetical protein [Streptomyces sp. ISL-22]